MPTNNNSLTLPILPARLAALSKCAFQIHGFRHMITWSQMQVFTPKQLIVFTQCGHIAI